MAKMENNKVGISPSPQPSTIVEEFELIRWDRPTKWFVGICIALFVIGVAGKFHFSHSSIWYQFFGETQKMKKNIIFGKPHTIRSDEWLVDVPSYFSQAENSYPLENPSIGPGTSALIQGLPVKHIITVFRPLHWGFMLFDVERGISWLWMWRTLGCIMSVFLMFQILTKSNFILSLFGAFFIYFSSGIQWWGIFTEPITFSILASIGLLGIVFSRDIKGLFIYTIIFILFSYSFVVNPLYPPRQVPVMYLVLIITIVYIIKNYKKSIIFNELRYIKIISIIGSAFLLGFLLIYFYLLNIDTLNIVFNTIYPGKRASNGGDLDWTKFFSEYYWLFLSADNIPSKWANICEASGFLLFFPVVLYQIIRNIMNKKSNDIMIIALTIYLFLGLVYMFIGFPTIISKLTLFSMAPPFRFLYGFGITNIFLVIVYLSSDNYKTNSFKPIEIFLFTCVSIGLLFLIGHFTSIELNGFLSVNQIIFSVLIFSTLFVLLLQQNQKILQYVFMCLVILIVIKNVNANPFSRTMEQFTKNSIRNKISHIVERDKTSGWIVMGNQMIISNFLKTTGANVWSGVKYAPDMQKLKILDPSGSKDSIYNRYAHILYFPYVSSNDTVIFNLAQMDMYTVVMDPCSERLRKIGVKYVVFTQPPLSEEVRCMELIDKESLYIYKFK